MASSGSLQGRFPATCGVFHLGSLCTQRSLIDLVNLFFVVIYCMGLLLASFGRQLNTISRPRNREFIFVSVCCAAYGVGQFGAGIWIMCSGQQRTWEWVDNFVRGLIWVVLAVSLRINQPTKWVRATILLWWLSSSLLISAYNVETLLRTHSLPILELISWPMSFLLLLCAFKLIFDNTRRQEPSKDGLCDPLLIRESVKTTELSKASPFSFLTFSWLNPLLRLGHSKPLELCDIPLLGSEDGALKACERFLKAWDDERKDKANTNNLVFVALTKCYSKELLLTGVSAFFKTVSVSALPLLLYAFVQYSYREVRDLNMGLLLIGCFVAVKLVESLSQRHVLFVTRRLGLRMRSALMAAIFQKQLKLSCCGRRKHSAGEIVNYIAVDAYKLGEFPFWFHMAWSLPLQLLFAILVLFGTVGLGALPGIVPLTIFGFLNVPFGKILRDYQSKFMVAQDERLRATSEVLNNMKTIKLQSWEDKFRKMIESLRDAEFKWLSEIQTKKSYTTAIYWMSPTIVSAVIFAGTAAMGTAPLDASTIFTVLAALRIMSEPVVMLPEVLSVVIQVKVSLDRIGAFLQEDELKEEDVKKAPAENSDVSVKVCDGIFSWEPTAATVTLKNINLSIGRGQKVAVCGPIGGGKSSVLYAILGQIPKISGSVGVFGSVAYVSQQPWIQSGTIRDNILFGKPMNKARYDSAIKCCALDKDIESFDHGDLTEIGQRGLNMSGGQKQRIQLARAVYNDADVYLLDDPFSAVDAHTAAILFHDCVMAALKSKTVILVTHQVQFIAETDKILVIKDGQVIQAGTYEEILKSGTAFEQLVNAHHSSMTALDSVSHENQLQTKTTFGDHLSSTLQPIKQNSEGEISVKGLSAVQLTEDEEKEIGDLGWKPYRYYLQVSNGCFLLALATFAQIAFVVCQSLSSYWLAVAVQMHNVGSAKLVIVYAVVSITSCLFVHMRSWVAALLGLRASKAFLTGFMDSVFKAPMLFFDSTPVGRILTRVSSDMSILDFDIPASIAFLMSGAIEVAAIMTVMVAVTWQVLVIAIPVMIMLVYVQRYYLASARELVRINGTTKAPVMNYATESLLGATTIRAFGMMERFIDTNLQLIDTDATLLFHTIAALEWVLLRVEALQSLTIITSALCLVFLPQGAIAPGFSGLCLSYALTLSATQVFLTRWYSNLETFIISVERIKQFMHIPSEPPAIISEMRPPVSWPYEGRIDLQELKIRYRPTAPFVLKGITCTFTAGNKVGVVGRTGSGKTTLISAIFRLVDPSGGRILIDNLDICSIGLKDLRMKLSIIPQEPTLFRGTVRSNLDPLGVHSDNDIWKALEKCQLKTTISNLPALLDSPVSDDGENWSVGQRQLFCLGRVLLRKNKILVLDEATASIDSVTDAILQRVIKQEFSSCTVITVAHRVPSVTDSDMVMVLSYGKLVECDNPLKLMESNNSAFSKLVAEYWSNHNQNSAYTVSDTRETEGRRES